MTTKDTRIARLRDALRHIANASCDADYDAAPAWATAALHEDDQLAAASSDTDFAWLRRAHDSAAAAAVFARACVTPAASPALADIPLKLPEPEPITNEERDAILNPGGVTPMAGLRPERSRAAGPHIDSIKVDVAAAPAPVKDTGADPPPGGHRCKVVGCGRAAVGSSDVGGGGSVVLCELHQLRPPPTSALAPEEEQALHEARAFCRMTEGLRERLADHLAKEGEDVLRGGWKDWTTAAEVLRHLPALLKLAELGAAYRQGHAPPQDVLPGHVLVPRRSWQMHARLRRAALVYFPEFSGRWIGTADHREIRDATEALRTAGIEHPADDPGPSFADEVLMHLLNAVCKAMHLPEGRFAKALRAILDERERTEQELRELRLNRGMKTLRRIAAAFGTEYVEDGLDQLMNRLELLVLTIGATAGRILELPDAIDYATGALRDLSRLAQECHPGGVISSTSTVDNALAACSELRGRKQQLRAYEDLLNRLRDAYRRPEDDAFPYDKAVDRAIALQQHYQRKALEQPQPPAARIVADFFDKVTADELAALFERFDWQDRGMAAVCEMLRALSKLAYPEMPKSSPLPPPVNIVAEFLEYVTAEQLNAVAEELDAYDELDKRYGLGCQVAPIRATATMLRLLSLHAYPDSPAT